MPTAAHTLTTSPLKAPIVDTQASWNSRDVNFLDAWLTLRQAANEVQAHPASLRRAIAAHRLRSARIGGSKHGAIRIRRSWLALWLEKSTTPIEERR